MMIMRRDGAKQNGKKSEFYMLGLAIRWRSDSHLFVSFFYSYESDKDTTR